jgi:hypothetical protein
MTLLPVKYLQHGLQPRLYNSFNPKEAILP